VRTAPPLGTDEPEVRQLAGSIIAAQKAEIGNMKAMADEMEGDSVEVELEPANGSGASGSATRLKSEGGVKVVLDVSGLPEHDTMYLAHIVAVGWALLAGSELPRTPSLRSSVCPIAPVRRS
jgi:Domain of unknown function (DUF305)